MGELQKVRNMIWKLRNGLGKSKVVADARKSKSYERREDNDSFDSHLDLIFPKEKRVINVLRELFSYM